MFRATQNQNPRHCDTLKSTLFWKLLQHFISDWIYVGLVNLTISEQSSVVSSKYGSLICYPFYTYLSYSILIQHYWAVWTRVSSEWNVSRKNAKIFVRILQTFSWKWMKWKMRKRSEIFAKKWFRENHRCWSCNNWLSIWSFIIQY